MQPNGPLIPTKTFLANGLENLSKPASGTIQKIHYLTGGDGSLFAMYVIDQNNIKYYPGDLYETLVNLTVAFSEGGEATSEIGDTFGGISSDDVKNYSNNFLWKEIARASAHGTSNGLIRLAQGGKFEHGFFAGFVSSGVSSLHLSDNIWVNTAISSAVGGASEAIGGGKFMNGAITGAYTFLFNHWIHASQDPPAKGKIFKVKPTYSPEPDATNLSKPILSHGDASDMSDNVLGIGDALEVGGTLYPNKVTPFISRTLTLWEAANQIYNGQYVEAGWNIIDGACGLYSVGAKLGAVMYQTEYMQQGLGRLYHADMMHNYQQYQLTNNPTYINRAIHYERLMWNTYNNLNNKQ